MSLFITETNSLREDVRIHNPKIDFICQCPKCGNYGTRNAHGRDEECPYCGTELDWKKEIAW